MGIVLVVCGHALGGIIDSRIGEPLPVFREIFLAIYIFHMPLFFFLSGLLVQHRLEKNRTGFATDLVGSIIYPYFLWSILQYSAIYGAGSLVNRPVSHFWPAILGLPIVSISQFWFLYVLFLLHAVAWLVVPRIGGRLFLALAIAAKLALPLLALPTMFRLAAIHGPFYALGVLIGAGAIGAHLGKIRASSPLSAILLVVVAATCVAAACWVIIDQNTAFFTLHSWQISALSWKLPVMPPALLAVTACVAIIALISGRIGDGLAYLGQRTMAIFVLHILMIAGVRIALTRLGFQHGALPLLLVCIVTGLGLPLAINAIVRRVINPRLLGLG